MNDTINHTLFAVGIIWAIAGAIAFTWDLIDKASRARKAGEEQ